MSNVYSLLSTGNTFGDWIVTTNAVVKENNDLAANSYHKASGTLYLDEPTTALQANGISIFQGYLHSTGVSGTQVDYNLTVQGQTYLSNTTLSLIANGQANMNGLLIAQGPGTSLLVANNANVQGNVAIVGNTTIANNLVVTYNTTSGNTYTLGTTVTLGNTFTNTLQSNVFVNTALLTVTGPAYTVFLQANNYVNTALVTVTGNVYANIVQANTSVNTSLLTVTGNTYVTGNSYANVVQANTSVNTALMTVTGNLYANNVQANTSVNTATISATGSITIGGSSTVGGSSLVAGSSITNSLQANNFVNTALLTVSTNTYSANVIANTSLLVKGITTLTGTANTLADLGVGGNLNVPNALFMGNSTSSANIYSLTVGQSVGNGGLTVQGNFTITSPTIYQSSVFTLYGGTPITSGNYGSFNVNRLPGSNASIRWDETNKYWATLNVASGLFNQIVTAEQLSNSSTSANTFNVATSLAVFTANTFLQANDATTLATSQSYTNSTIAANVVTLQSQIAANVSTIQSQIAANVSTIQSQIASNVISIQTQIASNVTALSSSANASNLTSGTISAARLPSSGVTVGIYGGASQIPVIQVDSTGRVTTAANTPVSSTLPISGDSTTGSVSLLNQTLKITSSNTSVITAVASGNTITLNPITSGVTAGAYGSSTAIPVITVDTFGRIQNLTTTSISTTINLSGTSGSGSVAGGGTLTFASNTNLLTFNVIGSTVYANTSQNLTTSGVPQFYNLALSTPLNISSGGTGAAYATGSGDNVLQNSPTLITPNIGTPSTGNLINCTINAGQITTALGYTPYSSGNPLGFLTKDIAAGVGVTLANTADTNSTTTGALQVRGGIGVGGSIYAGGNITAYSDRRLKTDIVNIPNALNKVSELNGVTFTRVDTGKRNTGLIAQELLKVLPESVFGSEEELYSVDYGSVIGLLVEAIKELKSEIDTLKGNK